MPEKLGQNSHKYGHAGMVEYLYFIIVCPNITGGNCDKNGGQIIGSTMGNQQTIPTPMDGRNGSKSFDCWAVV